MKGETEISSFQWKQIYDFVLECGKANNPHDFAARIIDNIGNFVYFDTASIYLLDGCGKLSGQYLRNIEERWSKIYLAYYINADDQRYSLFRKNAITNPGGRIMLRIYDWNQEKSTEFVPDFVQARGLKYTCGFGLYDSNNNLRMCVALDRTQGECYDENDLHMFRLIIPQLNNLYKNFFYQGYSSGDVGQAVFGTSLTARESQIAELLCQGLSPAQISQTLHITMSTTYKHIANTYEKLNVSSQRELLALLLKK